MIFQKSLRGDVYIKYVALYSVLVFPFPLFLRSWGFIPWYLCTTWNSHSWSIRHVTAGKLLILSNKHQMQIEIFIAQLTASCLCFFSCFRARQKRLNNKRSVRERFIYQTWTHQYRHCTLLFLHSSGESIKNRPRRRKHKKTANGCGK